MADYERLRLLEIRRLMAGQHCRHTAGWLISQLYFRWLPRRGEEY